VNEAYRQITLAPERDRRDLFVSAARRVGITEQNVEKDFWVCWTLDALFHGRREGTPRLLFKGGTSLSKAFGLITRFSEDIDITVFREDLGEPVSIDDLEQLSGKKRNAKLDAIREACQRYLREEMRLDLENQLFRAIGSVADSRWGVVLDDTDPDRQTLLVRYPTVLTADAYVRSEVRIECGAKSALDPHVDTRVLPYVGEDLPHLDLGIENITTIRPTRTFWDKIIIVHGLRAWFDNRGELRQEGQRISRHYYDLHALLPADIGAQALADLSLGAECVRHARMFFNRPHFSLETATPGSFALIPVEKMDAALRRDYDAMSGMIIGSVPTYENVLTSIASLEQRLNQRTKLTPSGSEQPVGPDETAP
jgi:Nucleotidyl transferase AbiEii toxin, Type IV TA system